MPVYSRRTRVSAPLADVWDFHAGTDGLEGVTPDWMHLRVERVVGPDGSPDPDVLEVGSEVQVSIRPFGVGPRQRWLSRIVERERSDGRAHFKDEMIRGPFETWIHTHRFFGDGDETVVVDHVEYELPLGPVGRLLGPVAVVGFEPIFYARHKRLQARFGAPGNG